MEFSPPSLIVGLGMLAALVALVMYAWPRVRPQAMLLVLLIVLAAGLWRAPNLGDGLPYLAYIDEGHVLHRSALMLEELTPFPGWYGYPSLTIDGAAGLAAVYDAVPGASRVTASHTEQASPYYDLGMPPALVLSGRIWVFSLALLTIAFIFITARLLFNDAAAVVAGLIATVLATVLLMSRRSSRVAWAFVAGCAAGAAATSMYVAGAALLVPIVAVLITREFSLGDRSRCSAVAVFGALTTVALTMPAVLFRPGDVWQDIRDQADIYSARDAGSYTSVLTDTTELGPLLAVAAVVGLVVLVMRDGSRVVTLSWLAFFVVYLGFLGRYDFQPVQTLVTIYPFLFVAAGIAVAWVYQWIREQLPALAARGIAAGIVFSIVVVSLFSGTVESASRDVTDNRSRAVDWLERHANGGNTVLIVEELAFLREELEDLRLVKTVPARDLRSAVTRIRPTYAVAGHGSARVTQISNEMRLVAHFGSRATPEPPNFWRGNNQAISVYRITSPRPRGAGRSSTSSAFACADGTRLASRTWASGANLAPVALA
jgi:hypothetical protein